MDLTQDVRPDLSNIQTNSSKDKELGLIPAWSYSSLKTFESCAYRIYISKVKKIQEDYGPAADRGTKIHTQAEDYVQGKLNQMPDTLKKFHSQFEVLRKLYKEGKVGVEGEWGFTIDWESCEWMAKDVWARIKLDAIVHESPTSARVIDYKTGKKFGNEIAHGQQALIYAIGSFFKYPELEHVQTELWYLDQTETSLQAYTREEAMMFMPGINERALTMTSTTKFPPNPSSYSCKWCSYKKGDSPMCEWGIK
jgi:CRISPR/Cas system-associated exonuclease Cas4 (RecB family)|tara:strand:- start:862 stop:1617 length:756 start_codon:yes stop_codon:yes gene_type:complete